jgi:hypothetical protein
VHTAGARNIAPRTKKEPMISFAQTPQLIGRHALDTFKSPVSIESH